MSLPVPPVAVKCPLIATELARAGMVNVYHRYEAALTLAAPFVRGCSKVVRTRLGDNLLDLAFLLCCEKYAPARRNKSKAKPIKRKGGMPFFCGCVVAADAVGFPHWTQKLEPSGSSLPHEGQNIYDNSGEKFGWVTRTDNKKNSTRRQS